MIFSNKLIPLLFAVLMICSLCSLSSVMVSASQPFNIEIVLPDSYKNVNPGSEVWFTVNLLNLANSQRVDVTLNYDILDSDGKSIVHNTKTVAIETQASFVANLQLPANTPPGDYTINVVVGSTLGESTAKTSLTVFTPKKDILLYYIGAGIGVLILIVFLSIKSKPVLKKIKLKMKIGKIVKDKLEKK